MRSPRRAFGFFMSTPYRIPMLVAVFLFVAQPFGWVSQLGGAAVLLGCGVALAPRLSVSESSVNLRRKPGFLRRPVERSSIVSVELCRRPSYWGGQWGLVGARFVLAGGEQIPILESGSLSERHLADWGHFLGEALGVPVSDTAV